jgi:hypothetical protein
MHTQTNPLPDSKLFLATLKDRRRPTPLLSPRELRRIIADMVD